MQIICVYLCEKISEYTYLYWLFKLDILKVFKTYLLDLLNIKALSKNNRTNE